MADGMFSKLINPDTAQPKVEQSSVSEAQKPSVSPIVKKNITDKPVEKKEVTLKQQQLGGAKVKEIRITLPLPTDLLSFLDQMERDIFIRRSAKFRSQQRLTKNSVARAWLALLRQLEININNIENEADLEQRLKKALDEFHIV